MAAASTTTKYLPLESNPDMLTTFIRKLGVQEPTRFVDVWSFDPDTLACFPQPIVAVCLLYPGNSIDSKRTNLKYLPLDQPSSRSFYIKQRQDEVGNACGTIAVLHALCNNLSRIAIDSSSPLISFAQQSGDANQLADGLTRLDFLHQATSESAANGQTATPNEEDDVNAHFICFCRSQHGHLVELDGCKPGPVDHGPCMEEELFARSIQIVREDMMTVDPLNVNFCVLALTTAASED